MSDDEHDTPRGWIPAPDDPAVFEIDSQGKVTYQGIVLPVSDVIITSSLTGMTLQLTFPGVSVVWVNQARAKQGEP